MTGGDQVAVDLSQIACHFSSLMPYQVTTVPYIPPDMWGHCRHCVGRVVRVAGTKYFLTPLVSGSDADISRYVYSSTLYTIGLNRFAIVQGKV